MIFENEMKNKVDMMQQQFAIATSQIENYKAHQNKQMNFRLAGTSIKPQDIVGLLMCHGARLRRNTRPKIEIHLTIKPKRGQTKITLISTAE